RDVLNLARHPAIVSALARLRQVRLAPQRTAGGLRDIYDRLGITREGPAYIQPLAHNADRGGVLLRGPPYSGRHLREAARNLPAGPARHGGPAQRRGLPGRAG